RLYVIESLMTLTGVNADHRLRVASSDVQSVAQALASGVVKSPIPGVDTKWIEECAKDLSQHKGQCLVMAGHRQPMAVHMLAWALNDALGSIGKTVVLHEVPDLKEGTIGDLAKALKSDEIQKLVILGANPAYTAPADADWLAAQNKLREKKGAIR